METLLVSPKNKAELEFVTELLKRMQIKTQKLSTEEKEDLGLIQLMKEVDRTQTVSKEEVMSKLGRK